MPQLIVIALVGGAIWYGYRAFKREMARVARETRSAEMEREAVKPLKRGEDGVYRPSDDA